MRNVDHFLEDEHYLRPANLITELEAALDVLRYYETDKIGRDVRELLPKLRQLRSKLVRERRAQAGNHKRPSPEAVAALVDDGVDEMLDEFGATLDYLHEQGD